MTLRRARGSFRGGVLHVSASLEGGGAERVLLTVLRELDGVDHVLALGGPGALLPLVPSPVPVHVITSSADLARLVVRRRPDAIHTWFDESLMLAAPVAAHLGVPLVHRLYNVPSMQEGYDAAARGRREMVGRALRAASRIVSLSAAAAEDAASFYGIDGVRVIHNGFPLAGGAGRSVASATKPAGRFVVLSVGRLALEKGHRHLIDALKLIAEAHPHVDVWIAGVGPLEGALRQQAAAAGLSGRVRLLGFREDLSSLHAAADLFVFPSLTEGFGNALGEALAAGLPIVVSDLPVVRRDFGLHERGAALVPPGDARALAAAIGRLASDPDARALLAHEARAVGARFGVARMIAAYRQVYDEVREAARVAA